MDRILSSILDAVLELVSHIHAAVRSCFMRDEVEDGAALIGADDRDSDVGELLADLDGREGARGDVVKLLLLVEELCDWRRQK